MEGTTQEISRPLLVTSRGYPGGDWADVARGAGAGWKLWRDRRHGTVFADFGHLGHGMSGVRLARLLRSASKEVRIFLLSDSADPAQKLWARANGADDVIQREAAAIAARLSGLYRDRRGDAGGDLPEDAPEHMLSLQLTPALMTHGRLGPAACVLVDEAIEAWSRANDGAFPTAEELARELAQHITSDRRRASFLACFGLEE
ncbi:hypothetical protein M8A51_18380 [Schlegelella sp. S2-27]|uniref:Response regulatory domain-containing protein n=1 Tax=Caldimonas mangrovi TaxID=2944811 RepID=A0ABT0YUJ5_9BURK|nr:hypothetical protein [Caldimonas mangrovi]MCM5681498.1 hypothetical protein [Caldimonas mangrovi]